MDQARRVHSRYRLQIRIHRGGRFSFTRVFDYYRVFFGYSTDHCIMVGNDHIPEQVNFSFQDLEHLGKVLEVGLILMLTGKDPVYWTC